MAIDFGWGRFVSRRLKLRVRKSRRHRPVSYQYQTPGIEVLESRRTPTTPPGDVAAAFSSFVAALNTDIPTHQPQYDGGIDAALNGIWSGTQDALADANTELDLSGSNWTDFTATVPTTVLSDITGFQGNTGGYLAGMKTDVRTSMVVSVSLTGVTLPTTIEWTEIGGGWNFSGIDESNSPYVGPPGTPPGLNYNLNRVNGTARIENGNIVIDGRFENRDRTTNSNGELIQETYLLTEAGMIQMPGAAGSLQGVRLDYIKHDYPTTSSGISQRLLFEGDPTDPSNGHVQATIATLFGNNAFGATFDKPAFGQPSYAGYISFTGADHTIRLSAGHNATDPSQDFVRGLFSMNKTMGTNEFLLNTEFGAQNNQKTATSQLMIKQPDALFKIQAKTSDAYGGMYHDWNVAGSAIYRFGASPLDLFTQIGYQKSRSGMDDFLATTTSFGTPDYSTSWRNQGFIVIPDPSLEGGYARVYAAIPLPKSMLPPQTPNAFGFGRRGPAVVLRTTTPFDHPLHGTTYFFGVVTGW